MPKAKLPPGPLKVFSGAGVTAILDANGNEVVGWPGFDDSYRTRAEHELLARELVRRYNDALGVADTRECTCHPDDNPPKPCPRKFALSECRAAAAGVAPLLWENRPENLGYAHGVRKD